MPPTMQATKVPGFRFDGRGQCFQQAAANGTKNTGGSWFNIGSPGQKVTNNNPARGKAIGEGRKQGGDWFAEARAGGTGGTSASFGSKSPARKAASARIAKIPLTLSRWIAATYRPQP